MTEFVTSMLVIFSQVGLLLALGAFILVIFVLRRKRRENGLARHFVEEYRQNEGTRKQSLMDVLQKVHEMDADLAAKTAEIILDRSRGRDVSMSQYVILPDLLIRET